MNIQKITNEHLMNRIKFFEKKLSNKPTAIYIGDSPHAELAVEEENEYNKKIAEKIRLHINEIKKEAKKRKLIIKYLNKDQN